MPRCSHSELIKFLANQRAYCPACEYDLRGLQADRYPECDTPLHLESLLRTTAQEDEAAFVAATIDHLAFLALLIVFGMPMGMYWMASVVTGDWATMGMTTPIMLLLGFVVYRRWWRGLRVSPRPMTPRAGEPSRD